MSINYGDKIPDGSDLSTVISYFQVLNNKIKELKTDLNTILQNEGVDTSKATRLEELINLVESEISSNKQKLANAIGEPVTNNDNVNEVCNKLNGLISSFKTALMNNEVSVGTNDKFKQLIEKVALIDKGKKYAEGTYRDFTEYLTTGGTTIEVPYELNFTPTLIFVKFDYINNTAGNTIKNAVISNKGNGNGQFYMNYGLKFNISDITSRSFSMTFSYGGNSNITFQGITWYVIGE